MTDKYLLFINIRNFIDEQYAIYDAAKSCGYQIIMLAPSIPEHLKTLTAIYKYNNNRNEGNSIKNALDLMQKYPIDAVFSWTDTDVVLCSKIAKALNIPSIDPEAAYRARNKYEMRKTIFNHNPNLVPSFVEVTSFDDIKNNICNIGFPAVLKPISASGSKGIFKVNNLEEAFQALQTLNELLNDNQEGWFYHRYGNKFIFETFIYGQEFSVEGLILNEDIFIAGITDKLTTNDWHLEYRHIFPANYPEEICAAIEEASKEVIRALGINNCPFHLEGKWTKNGFKLIEIAARIGGDLIHTHLIENSLNFNWLSFVITSLTKKQFPQIPKKNTQKYAGIQFILARDSQAFPGLNYQYTPDATPGLIKIEELIARGTKVIMPPQDFAMQRLGYILAKEDNFVALEQLLTSITAELTL